MQLMHLLPKKNCLPFIFFPLVILNYNEEEKLLENDKSKVSGNLHSIWFCSAEAPIKIYIYIYLSLNFPQRTLLKCS